MDLWSKGWLIQLNVKARGYVDTELKTNVGLSPQIIKGCIMNKPWYKVSFQAFFHKENIWNLLQYQHKFLLFKTVHSKGKLSLAKHKP